MANWHLFHGNGERQKNIQERLLDMAIAPPPWRKFGDEADICADENGQDKRWKKLAGIAQKKEDADDREIKKGKNFRLPPDAKEVIDGVNAAIYLRRPLLVTGRPGSGKTSLAHAIAYELNLGPVLSWAITARSNLQEGLYRYDAIGRLQDSQIAKEQGKEQEQDLGDYITLGALGTAFLPSRFPRVLLIDEIDKSDINLPNDLLNLFEEGKFPIQELVRRSQPDEEVKTENEKKFTIWTQDGDRVTIKGGKVNCHAFPIIIMTSNGERDFPPAFKRRCLRVTMPDPKKEALVKIVKAHFGENLFQNKVQQIEKLIDDFLPKEGEATDLATDQLLNTIYLLTRHDSPQEESADAKSIKKVLLQRLNS